MLLLAFAVFGWGLHYKLTLYEQAAQVRASEPAAKLLSERERGSAKAKPAATELSKPPVEAVILVSIALGLIPTLIRCPNNRIISQRRKVFSALFENSLFMRPPPVAFSLS